MQDRVSLYPGRVKLTPVAGQENVFDMVRADEPTQEGTKLDKTTLLTDEVAGKFGLGQDAVPNDVLNMVSVAALYHWMRRTAVLTETKSGGAGEIGLGYSSAATGGITVEYWDTAPVLDDGAIRFVGPPKSFTVTYNTYTTATTLRGKYWREPGSTTVYYSLTSAAATRDTTSSGSRYWVYLDKTYTVTFSATYGDAEQLISVNPDAYPHSGIVDGYEYKYYGNLLETAENRAYQYWTDYVVPPAGTFTYTFPYKPVLFFMTGTGTRQWIGFVYGAQLCVFDSSSAALDGSDKIYWDGNTVTVNYQNGITFNGTLGYKITAILDIGREE